MCGTSNLTRPKAQNIIYPYNIPIIYINIAKLESFPLHICSVVCLNKKNQQHFLYEKKKKKKTEIWYSVGFLSLLKKSRKTEKIIIQCVLLLYWIGGTLNKSCVAAEIGAHHCLLPVSTMPYQVTVSKWT